MNCGVFRWPDPNRSFVFSNDQKAATQAISLRSEGALQMLFEIANIDATETRFEKPKIVARLSLYSMEGHFNLRGRSRGESACGWITAVSLSILPLSATR